MPDTYVPTTEEAFAIADEAMVELLRSELLPLGTDLYGLVDESQAEVSEVEHTGEGTQRALRWALARGLVELTRDGSGVLVRFPLESPSHSPSPRAA